MNRYILLLTISILLSAFNCVAQHGGHGVGHSFSRGRASSGSHSFGRTSFGSHTPSTTTASPRAMKRTSIPATAASNYAHTTKTTVRPVTAATNTNTSNSVYASPVPGTVTNEPYYYPYMYYGYAPYYYNPYYSMWAFGIDGMFTPHYNLGYPNNYNQPNYNEVEEMKGYAVYENDTLKGAITIKGRTVSVKTADGQRDYDYTFRPNKKGLQYVEGYNNDSVELNLVRLKENDKKLWRVIHTGKLNVYDGGTGFIYRPEDVDASTILVVYNGEEISLHSHNRDVTKQRLTAFINKAYGTDVNPNNMSWKSLLIYLDKKD